MIKHWYDGAIVYQVYPKSFLDTDGDGIGDIRGVIKKVPYLKELGVNTIWLNPIYVSPQIDNGYDVSNYYAVDESLGTLADVKQLVEIVHQNGMHIILDFVMNHTSNQHPWFQDVLKNPHSIYRDYYLFEQTDDGKVPNNWASFFGGSVWEKIPSRDCYYFHLFAKEMPDLNWSNPEVRLAMIDIAKFWLDVGIDGFRLDAFIHMAKADLHTDFPTDQPGPVIAEPFFANLPQVQTYLAEFITKIRAYKPNLLIIGEAASAEVNLAVDYTEKPEEACNNVITFRYFKDDESKADPRLPIGYQDLPLDQLTFRQTMATWQETLKEVSLPTLYWNNHDMPRIATRFASETNRVQSSKMLATLMYLQRGIPILYYGEEIGMENVLFNSIEDFQDNAATAYYEAGLKLGMEKQQLLQQISHRHKLTSRSGMQWDDSKNHGFSSGTPWLAGESNPLNVAAQLTDKQSILHYYQDLLALKQIPLFTEGDQKLLPSSMDLFVYKRSLDNQQAFVVCNQSGMTQRIQLPVATADVVLSQGKVTVTNQQVTISAYGAVVFLNQL